MNKAQSIVSGNHKDNHQDQRDLLSILLEVKQERKNTFTYKLDFSSSMFEFRVTNKYLV